MKIIPGVMSALLWWGVTSGTSLAYILKTADVVSGYSDCYMFDNGDGTSTAGVNFRYNETNPSRLGNATFYSRGVMFYSYDKLGKPHNVKAKTVYLAGTESAAVYQGENYLMYFNNKFWNKSAAITMQVTLTFSNTLIKDWGAVSIRAGNYTDRDDVGEITGGAYISVDNALGSCKLLVDPTKPPAPPISIIVNAPDWDLGEIKPGEQNIPFSASKDRLCLIYSAGDVASKQFIITASSKNGEVNNQYRLKNQDDDAQIIPYQLALDSGSQQLTLPNSANKSLPLEARGATCFMPTFTTFAPKNIGKGDYSDVLTFNIVSKS